MVWAQIILLVIKLLSEIPAIQEWLERIFGALGRARPLQAAREGAHILAALKAKEAQLAEGFVSAGPCPIQACALRLDAKYPAE